MLSLTLMADSFNSSRILRSARTLPFSSSSYSFFSTISLPNNNNSAALGRRLSQLPSRKRYDAIVIGGGHNGLTAAAYLARADKKVLVVERRHLLGGAAVTEEIVPGFRFSRASYCFSLFRPIILRDLELHRHGLTLLPRNPSTFSPLLDGRHLLMGPDEKFNCEQVSKFSKKDAAALPEYEKMLERLFLKFDPLMDLPPFDPNAVLSSNKSKTWKKEEDGWRSGMERAGRQKESLVAAGKTLWALGKDVVPFLEICTAPASKVLGRWFESEPLLSKLATDAVTGALVGPHTPGSGYVLFHHCMGDVGYGRGIWTYVQGGMGAVSAAIASSAKEFGAELLTNAEVKSLLVNSSGAVKGVELKDEEGTEIHANCVLSNADPYTSYSTLVAPEDFQRWFPDHVKSSIQSYDYSSATFKINLALDRLPNFKSLPNKNDNTPGPSHTGTIHFLENTAQLDEAYNDSLRGIPSRRPFIEMTIPSSLDKTISPPGKHVALLFCQYAPFKLANGASWDDPGRREAFAQSCYKVIEEYAPGFTASILGEDLLSPLDLQRTLGLRGGNIFHGGMGLDQLYWLRPVAGYSRYRTPISGYYLCGSGAHPGGGVMGAPGRNAAIAALQDMVGTS